MAVAARRATSQPRIPTPLPGPESLPSFLDQFEQEYRGPREAPPPAPTPVVEPYEPPTPPPPPKGGAIRRFLTGLPSTIGQAVGSIFTPEARQQAQQEGEQAMQWERGEGMPELPRIPNIQIPDLSQYPPADLGLEMPGAPSPTTRVANIPESIPELKTLTPEQQQQEKVRADLERLAGQEPSALGRVADFLTKAIPGGPEGIPQGAPEIPIEEAQAAVQAMPEALGQLGMMGLETAYHSLPGLSRIIGGVRAKIEGRPAFGYGEGEYTPEDIILGLGELGIAAGMGRGEEGRGPTTWAPGQPLLRNTAEDIANDLIERMAGMPEFALASRMAKSQPGVVRDYLLGGRETLLSKGYSENEADTIDRALLEALAQKGRAAAADPARQGIIDRLKSYFQRAPAEEAPPAPGAPQALPGAPEAAAPPEVPPVAPTPPTPPTTESTLADLRARIERLRQRFPEEPRPIGVPQPSVPIEPTEPLIPGTPIPLPPVPPAALRPAEPIAAPEELVPGGPAPLPPIPPATVRPEETFPAAEEPMLPGAPVPAPPMPLPPGEGEVPPEPPTAKVRKNNVQQGVEVKFSGRPPDSVLQQLREAGFRWNRRKQLWFAAQTPENEAIARRLAEEAQQPVTPELPEPPAVEAGVPPALPEIPVEPQTAGAPEAEVLPQPPAPAPQPRPPLPAGEAAAAAPLQETPALPPEEPRPAPGSMPSQQLATWVREKLSRQRPFTSKELFLAADHVFGGTQAQGRYTPKDAYDAMELGVNQYILHTAPILADPTAELAFLSKLTSRLPTQAKRTGEQDLFQQFSTPPHLAYLAARVANIQPGDVVLEPSAGVGGLASFARRASARTIVNELSPRRAELLRQMGFDRVFTENAEQLHNILPPDVKPTVVLMNPPFSSAAGRLGEKTSTRLVIGHLEQALSRLEPGGRLVAIVGKGLADERSAFKTWWNGVKARYNVRANLGLPGKEYAKYGTTFDNQLLIIDKTGPTPQGATLTQRVESLEEALPLLEGIRNDRQPSRVGPPERAPGEPTREAAPAVGGGGARPELPVPPATPGLGPVVGGGGGEPRPAPVAPGEPGGAGGVAPEPSPSLPAGPEAGGGVRVGAGGAELPGPGGPGPAPATTPAPAPAGGEPNITIEQQAVPEAAADISTSIYEPYQPQKLRIPGAQPHPGKLVQSAAMASVEPPNPTYTPKLTKTITDKLSIAQLEAVVYAGQAHQRILPEGERQGFYVGDSTGVGKGREIAGIILDNMTQGRTKAVWISTNGKLFNDAKRDFGDTGGDIAQLFDLGKVQANSDIKTERGVLFTTYSTLRNAARQTRDASGNLVPGQKRLDQIIKWLGEDFDGVIALDEAHLMQNALAQKGQRGMQAASAQALSGIDLQKKLPKARIIYVSATGATEVSNLAYAERLGLWGRGTPFANVQAFVNQIRAGGLAAMELVARDLKARGLYISRGLSFDDVTYETLEHPLTPEQRNKYNEMAEAWQTVLQHINTAMQTTGASQNAHAKSAAMSGFWSAHQRFFNQMITSMQMPSVLARLRQDLNQGYAAVLQLVNTNEAIQERRLAALAEEDISPEDLVALDLTPKENLMQYIQNSFPVQQYEEYVDENGNERTRPVVDSTGNPVQNADAVAAREALLDRIGSPDFGVPEGALEQLINTFGPEKVAEVTGRSRRVVRVRDVEGEHGEVQRRGEPAALADAKAFMDDKKPILVFSDAGGTGQSYHAALASANQRKRQHYLVQPGWRADRAVQGMGRTHRTNEASAPNYVLVTTDLKGQKRFLSSIARRLDQLGALTKGQRQTGGQGLFSARDNLESEYAQDAMRQFWIQLHRGQVEGLDFATVTGQMGLDLIDSQTGNLKTDLPPVTQFLNRILSLNIDTQNAVFDAFFARVEQQVAHAIANGTLDVGVETVQAMKTDVQSEQTVYTDPESGAETRYVHVQLTHPRKMITFEDRADRVDLKGFYLNDKSGRISAVYPAGTKTLETGQIVNRYYSQSPTSLLIWDDEDLSKVQELSRADAKRLWNETVASTPSTYTEDMHLLTGTLLPIWDRLIGPTRVLRLQSSDGRRFLGRMIPPAYLRKTLENLGATASAPQITPEDAVRKILDDRYTIGLANGWTIKQSRVSGEPRIEITGQPPQGLAYADIQALTKEGAFTERIQFNTRVFLPTGPNAASVFGAVTQYRPVVSVQPPVRSADDVLAAQRQVDTIPATPTSQTYTPPSTPEVAAPEASIAEIQARPVTGYDPNRSRRLDIGPPPPMQPPTSRPGPTLDAPLEALKVPDLPSLDAVERVPGQGFYALTLEKNLEASPRATSIQIPGFESLDTFIHPSLGKKGWSVSEGITGQNIVREGSRPRAIEVAKQVLEQHGLEKAQEAILRMAKQYGITPRYRLKGTETGRAIPPPPPEPPAGPPNPQMPDHEPRNNGLSALVGDEEGAMSLQAIGNLMDAFTHALNATRPKLWSIQEQAPDVFEAAMRQAASRDHAKVVARGFYEAMKRIAGVREKHLQDFARYWNSEMGKGILRDPERAPNVRVKILAPDEEDALLDDPIFQKLVMYYRQKVQPLMEELAPSAGIQTFLETPSGFYGKLHALKTEDDATDPTSVKARLGESMPKRAVGYTTTGQIPRQLSRKRARAAIQARGSGVYSEDLQDMLEHMIMDRFTAAYKNQLIEVVQRYKVPVNQKTRRAPQSVEFAGEEVPVVLSDVGTAKARAMAYKLPIVPLEDIWLPKPVEDAWREVTVGSKLDETRVPVLSQLGNLTTAAMLIGPADAVMHGLNVLMALTNAPGMGQSLGMFGRALAWTPAKLLAVMADIFHLPAEEMQRVLPILSEYGGLRTAMFGEHGKFPERLGESIAGEVGRKIGYGLSALKRAVFDYPSWGNGLKGIESRARVALYKAMEAKYPQMSPAERVMRMNNFMGTYVPTIQPELIKMLRMFGLGNPFAVATFTLGKTGLKGLVGKGPGGFSWETLLQNWIAIPMLLYLVASNLDPEGDTRDPWEQPGWDPLNLRVWRDQTSTVEIPLRYLFNSYARGLRWSGIGTVAKAVAAGEKDPAELTKAWLRNGLNVAMSLANGPFGSFIFGAGAGVAPYLTERNQLLPLERPSDIGGMQGLYERLKTGAKAAIPLAREGFDLTDYLLDPLENPSQTAVRDSIVSFVEGMGQFAGVQLKHRGPEREMAAMPGRAHTARLAEIADDIARELRRVPIEQRREKMEQLLNERVKPNDQPLTKHFLIKSFQRQWKSIGRNQPRPPLPQPPKTGTEGP